MDDQQAHEKMFKITNYLGNANQNHERLLHTRCCRCCCWVTSVVSDSVRPQRQQPTRLPRPWDSLGKNTGVGCHFLLQCMQVKSEGEIAQSCPTLSDLMDCSLPGSSIHGIFQARVLEWGAIAFSFTILYFYIHNRILWPVLVFLLAFTSLSNSKSKSFYIL